MLMLMLRLLTQPPIQPYRPYKPQKRRLELRFRRNVLVADTSTTGVRTIYRARFGGYDAALVVLILALVMAIGPVLRGARCVIID